MESHWYLVSMKKKLKHRVMHNISRDRVIYGDIWESTEPCKNPCTVFHYIQLQWVELSDWIFLYPDSISDCGSPPFKEEYCVALVNVSLALHEPATVLCAFRFIHEGSLCWWDYLAYETWHLFTWVVFLFFFLFFLRWILRGRSCDGSPI